MYIHSYLLCYILCRAESHFLCLTAGVPRSLFRRPRAVRGRKGSGDFEISNNPVSRVTTNKANSQQSRFKSAPTS